METALEKTGTSRNWMDLYFKHSFHNCYYPNLLYTSKLNSESFRGIISKLKDLKEDNKITEKQFVDVLLLLATNYIENEVELRVNSRVNQTICQYFEKL